MRIDILTQKADRLIAQCGCLKPGERVAIIYDASTRDIAKLLGDAAQRHGAERIRMVETPALAAHGADPSQEACQAMLDSDLICGVTALSMAHTAGRSRACKEGARYLSLPDYSIELLMSPAIDVDYQAVYPLVRAITDRFDRGRIAHVQTRAGTDMTLLIDGRAGNCCPGFVATPGSLGSPPDIEANISPVEHDSNGLVVVDGSIPHPRIGLLKEPITLVVENGRIVKKTGPRAVVDVLDEFFSGHDSDKKRVLAECGVGLNPKAQLSGHMLTDEGAFGTMHFGFGSNATVGGKNEVPFHLDFVFREATLRVDGCDLIVDGVPTAEVAP